MSAQLESIRRAVAQRAKEPWVASAETVIVVGSGKGGSGGSTVAALLALAASGSARLTLLVDGDEQVGTLHRLLGVEAPNGLGSLYSGSITPDEAILPLDPLLDLLPGGSSTDAEPRTYAPGNRRTVFRRIAQLYGSYDVVIIDAGSRLDSVIAAASPAVRRFVAVTGADPVALASAYALIKAIDAKWPGAPIELLVNGHEDDRAHRAHQYVQTACERFLHRDVSFGGTIPEDEQMQAAVLAGQPLAQAAAGTRAGLAAQAFTGRLLADLDHGSRRSAAQRPEKWRE